MLVALASCYSRKEKTEINNCNNTDAIKKIQMQTDSINNNKAKKDIALSVMSETKVTGEFERLDMELFHQCMEESRANGLGNIYTKRLDSGIEIELDGRDRSSKDIINEITYKETHPDSYFSIYKIYDSRGYIKEKGLLIAKSMSTSKMGTWYYYDESGKLINEINYDKPYTFTFNDVLEFCKKEKIPVTKGIDFPYKTMLNDSNEPYKAYYETYIGRSDKGTEVKYSWLIIYYNGIGTKRTDIMLDGKTGKVLSRHSEVIVP